MSTAIRDNDRAPNGHKTSGEPVGNRLTVDLSNVFEFNRDAEQVVLETTQEELIAAFQNAIDDWNFMNEAPREDGVPDVADELIDSALFDECDPEELAMQCI